ncbi:helix-turn-helix domain-containing protein [Streptomyces sp. KN37]|uniref:helix-turn-helix domain-containing protein n=1 Tax=Streptomyces sp. KN37 TaxID=3090667 RepID=UPI002A76147F|nr:helix-turn-helix domain-containing protein [Streptomyces sp. KN37]WPO73968.1 helix-turn-helix domain-containing protein [Streptomyces sp. KN37]
MERDRDWVRLGRAFAEARKGVPLTQEEVAERLHVSRTPVQAIERGRQSNGKNFTKVTSTMRSYARLVCWTEDSIDQVLAGGDPRVIETPEAARPHPLAGLSPAVEMELHSGETVDQTVLHLGPNESDARVVVIVKSGENATKEEMDEAMRQWSRARRHLQSITSDPEATPDS